MQRHDRECTDRVCLARGCAGGEEARAGDVGEGKQHVPCQKEAG